MKNSHTFSRICGYAMFLLILAQIVLVLASWLITAAMPDVFSPVIAQPGRYPMVLRHFHRQPAVTLAGMAIADQHCLGNTTG